METIFRTTKTAIGTEGYLFVYIDPVKQEKTVEFKIYKEGERTKKYEIRHHDLKIELLDEPASHGVICEGKPNPLVYLLLYPSPTDKKQVVVFRTQGDKSIKDFPVNVGYHRVKLLDGLFVDTEGERYIDYEYARIWAETRPSSESRQQSGDAGAI